MTVIEDDVPVVDVTPTVSVAEAAGSAAFVVTLDLASDKDVTVVYATVDGSAVSPGDYAGVQDTLVVAAGDTSGTVTVAIVDDADDEAEAETFQLRLSAPANAQLKGATDALTATATIRDDDDPAVTVAFESALVVANEGGAGTVAVTIDVDPERDIVIPVAAVPGDGAAPSDYSGVPPSLTFTAGGARRQTFSVAATDDDVDDDGETVGLSFGDLPDRVEAGDPKTATVHLGDNDQKAARTQVQGGAGRHVTVVEGGAASYRLSLSSEPTSDVVVAVAGAAGTDLSTPASLTFTPGNWNVDQTVTVTAAEDDDALDDAPVTLTHTATGGGYADVEFPEVIVTIVENDRPVVDVTRAVTVAEDAGTADFEVTLDQASSNDVTVDYGTTDGSARVPADYTDTNGTLTVPAGGRAATIGVPIVDDSVAEADQETFTLVLRNPSGASLAGGANELTATATVTDNDDPDVTLRFASAAHTAAEGGEAVVEVRLDAAPERQLVVPLTAASAGGATAADYSGVPQALTFAAAETLRAFTLAVAQDEVDDDGEQVSIRFGPAGDTATEGQDYTAVDDFVLTIAPAATAATVTFTFAPQDDAASEGGEAALVTGSADGLEVDGTRLDLRDDDAASAAVLLSVSPAAVSETAGSTPVTVTAVLDGTARAGATVVTVSVGATGDTATAGTDYTSVADFTLTINANATAATRTFTFAPTDDAAAEGGESLTVSGAVAGDELAVVGAVLRIADGDRASSRVGLSLSPGAAAEAGGSTDVVLTATLDGTARATATPVRVRVGWLPPRVSLGTPELATVHLVDDDARGVTVSTEGLSIPEGENRHYTVVLGSEPTGEVVVTVAVPSDAPLTAAPPALTFTPASWRTSQTVTVTAPADDDAVIPEPVVLGHTVTGADYDGEPAASLTVYVGDSTVPEVSLDRDAASVAENGGQVTFTATLGAASTRPVTVDYETADGTAVAGEDYIAESGSLTFEPGGPLQHGLTVLVRDDLRDEEQEQTFTLALTAPVGATLGDPRTATVTIADDDDVPTVSLPTTSRSVAEAGAEAWIDVSLSVASDRVVTVHYATSDGSTAEPGTVAARTVEDYAAASGTITFAPGTTSHALRIAIHDDEIDEGASAAFTVTLSDPVNRRPGPSFGARTYLRRRHRAGRHRAADGHRQGGRHRRGRGRAVDHFRAGHGVRLPDGGRDGAGAYRLHRIGEGCADRRGRQDQGRDRRPDRGGRPRRIRRDVHGASCGC